MAWYETGGGGYEGSDGDRAFAEALGDEDARRWDLDYALKKQGLDQQYSIAKLNARTASERNAIDKWYNQQQIKLAQDRLAFDRYSFDKTFGLNQAKLGYDLIQTGAQLHNNPADYFNEAEWARGVRGRPETSTFLQALQDNTRLPDFVGRGSPAEVNSLGTLAAKLGAGGGDGSAAGGGSSPENNYLAQIGNIGVKGPHQLGAGSLEQLTPTEFALFTGGLSKLGYDPDTFMAGYRRSRIGQGTAGSAAA